MEEELNQTEQTRQSLLNPTQPDFNKALETAEAEEAAIQERQARYEANPIEEVEEIPQVGAAEPEQPDAEKIWDSYDQLKEEGRLDEWYLEHYGRTKAEHDQLIAENHDLAGLMSAGRMGAQLAAGVGLSAIDTAVDVMALPGVDRGGLGQEFNQWWDKTTRFENPAYQAVRDLAGVLLPIGYGSKMLTGAVKAGRGTRLQKALKIFGGELAMDAAFLSVSDQGTDENLSRQLDDMFPQLNIPDSIKTLDSDSSEVRRIKNLYESGPMTFVGNVLGTVLGLVNKLEPMKWWRPKDAQAELAKKAAQQANNQDPETVLKLAQIDEAMASESLTTKEKATLTKTRQLLVDQMENTGVSDVTSDPFEANVFKEIDANAVERDAASLRKLEEDPFMEQFDPVVTPMLAKEGTTSRTAVKAGNVIKNAADNSAIHKGMATGDPAPIVSESMLRKFLKAGGRSRKAVVGLMEAARDAGDYDVIVNNFRQAKSTLDDDAFNRYVEIVGNHDVDALRKSFKKSTIVLKDGAEQTVLNEVDKVAVQMAIRDLTDMYLGRATAGQSANFMNTLSAEVRTLSESALSFPDVVDENIVMEKVIDKLTMLSEEYATAKYLWGWQGNNLNFFNKTFSGAKPRALVEMTLGEFEEATSRIHKQKMDMRKTLMGMRETQPELMRPLFEAFVNSKGEIDTVDKLTKYAFDQINPANYIYNEKGQNLFSKGLTSIVLNNVLSGLSAARAILGNSVAIANNFIESGLGHFPAFTKNADEWNRFRYIYGGIQETNRRALNHAWETMKDVIKDPANNLDAIRKDLQYFDDRQWDAVDAVAENVWKNENKGAYYLYQFADLNDSFARSPVSRYNSILMSGADGYTQTVMSTQIARIRAYDNLHKAGKPITVETLQQAEKEVMSTMFDKNGKLTDWAANHATKEAALNLDNEFADWLTATTDRIPMLRHLLMFPRTGVNFLAKAGSYIGLSAIPGATKYGKVLYARTDKQIAEALAAHGLTDMSKDPNAMAIFKHLKRVYAGRLAFTGMLVGGLYSYAMMGNLRGPGAINPNERKLQRDSLNQGTQEIKVGNVWFSYKGIDTVEPILDLLGDHAYHARDLSPEAQHDALDRITYIVSTAFLDGTGLNGLRPLMDALNGNETAWNRLVSNTARGYIPFTGAQSVVAQAIDSSLKDIHNDLRGYMFNRIPGANTTLPQQIDFWTGEAINDIGDPLLRMLNALSPIKVRKDQEPWRRWLFESGWDGMQRIRFASGGGNFEYTPEQRELIYRYMAEENLSKIIAGRRFMKNPRWKKMIEEARQIHNRGAVERDKYGNEITTRLKLLPLHQQIDDLLDEAKERAELRLRSEYPEISQSIFLQKRHDQLLKEGRGAEADQLMERIQNQTDKKNNAIRNFANYR